MALFLRKEFVIILKLYNWLVRLLTILLHSQKFTKCFNLFDNPQNFIFKNMYPAVQSVALAEEAT